MSCDASCEGFLLFVSRAKQRMIFLNAFIYFLVLALLEGKGSHGQDDSLDS